MKIKIPKLLYIIMIIVLLINCRFFFMYYVNPIYGLFLTLFEVMLVCIAENKWNRNPSLKLVFVRRICIITGIIFLIFAFFSKLEYQDQSWSQTLIGESGQYHILMVFLAYPMISISREKKGIKWLFDLMNAFSGILYVLVLAQFILYNVDRRVFLPYFSTSSELLLLRGSLRISLSWFGNYMIIYNFYMFYRERYQSFKKTLLYGLLFALGLTNCLLVERVRGISWVVVACIIYIVFSNRNTSRGFWKKGIAVLGIGICIFGTDIVSNYIGSLSISAERGYSTYARLYAIRFFWDTFIQNPFFGFGFADGSIYHSLVHGNGMANISDVGIFGQLAKYGMFVIPIYVYPLGRSFIKLWKLRNSAVIKDYPLYFSFFLYMFLSSATYIAICSQSLIILWPVYLVVTEYVITADALTAEIFEP